MKKISILAFLLSVAGLGFAQVDGGDLQKLLDEASKTSEKFVSLDGKHFRLQKPVVLDARHSGLRIDGKGAVVSGLRVISGWKKSNTIQGAWEADLKSDKLPTSIFVNGVRAQISKHPNDTKFLAHSKVDDGTQFGRKDCFFVEGDAVKFCLSLSKTEIANAYLGLNRNWTQECIGLKSVENAKDGLVKISSTHPLGMSMFWYCQFPNFEIYNTKSGLDLKGEYYFDRENSKIYYIPRDNEDIATAVVEYPFVDIPFQIEGSVDKRVEQITIKNVSFEGGVVGLKDGTLPKDDYFLNRSQSACSSIANVKVSYAFDVLFMDCQFTKSDSYGLWLAEGVSKTRVKGCKLFDLGLGGMKIGIPQRFHLFAKSQNLPIEKVISSDITIQDNLIYNFGKFSRSGAGVLAFDVPRCKIEHNEIFDGYYTGISYGWTWGAGTTATTNTSISFNKIHDLAYGHTNDIGGIYTLGTSPNSKIEGNVIYNIECMNYGAWGIYNDEGSKGWKIFKNFVRNTSKGGYFMHYGQECEIVNNIICFNRDYQVGLGRKNPNSYTFQRNVVVYSEPAVSLRQNQFIAPNAALFDKNIYWVKNGVLTFAGLTFEQWQKAGQDLHSFVEEIDPIALSKSKKGIEKIGFEPLNIKKAGVRGKYKKEAKQLLKNYKYPKIFTHDFALIAKPVKFEKNADILLASPEVYGKKMMKMCEENGMKFLRMTDTDKSWTPCVAYQFRLDAFDFIKAEFKARFTENSTITFQARPNFYGGGMPSVPIVKGKLFGVDLPKGKWLKFECIYPTHVNSSKRFNLKVFDGDKKLMEREVPYNTPPKLYSIYFICTDGGNGEITDIAEVSVLPYKNR